MGFLDNVRARFRNNDERAFEEEFERAFREGTWPEGVDDFAPLANTGSFLPPTYDIDPLADESLPGNAMSANHAPAQQARGGYDQPAEAPQAYGAPTAVYAQPAPESPFQVIDASMRPRTVSGAVAADPDATVQSEPVVRRASGPSAPARRREEEPGEDDGVQVFSRQGGERAPRSTPAPAPAAKPFADRLRERVVAASAANAAAQRGAAAGQDGRARGGAPAAPAPAAAPSRAPRGYAPAAPAPEREPEFDARRQDRRPAASERPVAASPEAERAPRRSVDLYERDRRPVDRDSEHMAERVVERIVERSSGRGGYDRPVAPERAERFAEPAPRAYEQPPAARPYEQPPARPASAPTSRAAAAGVPVSCIVLRPRSYDVVSEIAQGVIGERRPVVLVLRGCNNELTRRILDFSFGLCCASGAGMREFGDRVYAIVPRGTALADEDMVAMRRQGILKG